MIAQQGVVSAFDHVAQPPQNPVLADVRRGLTGDAGVGAQTVHGGANRPSVIVAVADHGPGAVQAGQQIRRRPLRESSRAAGASQYDCSNARTRQWPRRC